jgi:hypothetical protein
MMDDGRWQFIKLSLLCQIRERPDVFLCGWLQWLLVVPP